MSVTLNEGALELLLNSPQSPVAAEITRRAENVVELAQANAREIMWRLPTVVNQIDFALDDTLTAFIGIEERGRPEEYLARKAVSPKEGAGSWLLTAFLQGWNT